MNRSRLCSRATLSVLMITALVLAPSLVVAQEAQFGAPADVDFAHALWEAMSGYQDWLLKSDIYPGVSPHGLFLRMYYNVVNIGGAAYHVVIKDNFGGKDLTLEAVKENPNDHLKAVTVMVQREAGYDSDNNDWYWVKFGTDGTIDRNEGGTPLAGRVAKGSRAGCIACHVNAAGGDYLFTNDEAPAIK
ncbi:MAG: cytochrome P460 family protein [Candidatus Eisenbacteria bacterium]|nr:cytochrome P460 family protein [Candidatus Eisenbacteria bacterium]